MKILHLNDTYAATGGITHYLFSIMNLLESHGHENVMIYQEQHHRTVVDDHKVYYVPPSADQYGGRSTIRRIVYDEKPDLAYVHAVYDPRIISEVSSLIPTVAYVHGFHVVCPGLAKYFRKGDEICKYAFGLNCILEIYFRRCASAKHPLSVARIMRVTAATQKVYQRLPKILVASNYMRELMLQNGFTEDKIIVLPYPEKLVSFVSTLSMCEPKRILFAGRLEIEKGIPYLLRAMCYLKNPFELRIAGDGTLRSVYEKLTANLGLNKYVKFLGWLDKGRLDAEYQASTVVAMPSIFPEPFGQVGVQAMLHGRPVVAFNVGGISDWLIDGKHGFQVELKNVKLFATRLDELLVNPDLAQKMGMQGREFAIQCYAPEKHITQLLAIFNQTLAMR